MAENIVEPAKQTGLSVMVNQPVVDESVVPFNTTMLYFNNDDNTPVACWKLDGKDKQHAKFLLEIEAWMWMRGPTAQQTIDLLVKAANQDGSSRTSSLEPLRRPRFLLVNHLSMGGLRGACFESNQKGWLHMTHSQVHYFDKPYKFWELPGDKQPVE